MTYNNINGQIAGCALNEALMKGLTDITDIKKFAKNYINYEAEGANYPAVCKIMTRYYEEHKRNVTSNKKRAKEDKKRLVENAKIKIEPSLKTELKEKYEKAFAIKNGKSRRKKLAELRKSIKKDIGLNLVSIWELQEAILWLKFLRT